MCLWSSSDCPRPAPQLFNALRCSIRNLNENKDRWDLALMNRPRFLYGSKEVTGMSCVLIQPPSLSCLLLSFDAVFQLDHD